MKKLLVLVLLAATSLLVVPAAFAEDQTERVLTLEDGTQLTLPPSVRINRDNITPGADVKARHQVKGDQNVVTSIQVQPAEATGA